jgi:hypothetical protein
MVATARYFVPLTSNGSLIFITYSSPAEATLGIVIVNMPIRTREIKYLLDYVSLPYLIRFYVVFILLRQPGTGGLNWPPPFPAYYLTPN